MAPKQLDQLLSAAIAEVHRGDLTCARRRLAESGSDLSKAEVTAAVRKAIKRELPDEITKELKRQIKNDDTEELIRVIVGKVMAKFFELMYTRKGQWQSQLKNS